MIEFKLTEKQLAWQNKARDFAKAEVKPIALSLDRKHSGEFYWDIVKKAVEYGLAWLDIPKKWGGVEVNPDCVTKAIILEEIAVGDAGVSFTTHFTWSHPALDMSEEMQERFLTGWCDKNNPKLVSLAISEPGAGSDMTSMITTARLEGNGWVINGTKHFISQGGVASVLVVYATIDRNLGASGIRAFIVSGDAPGITVTKPEDKMGFRSSQTAELVFNNVRVPKEYMLVGEGGKPRGIAELAQELTRARILTAGGISVGIARAAYEAVVAYFQETSERQKAALDHQIISFTLADMAALIDASRLMVWRAAWSLDHYPPAMAEAAMCKYFCSDAAMRVATDALQLIGLHGYGKDYTLEKYFRDAKLMSIYEGTNEINRLIVTRSIFPRR